MRPWKQKTEFAYAVQATTVYQKYKLPTTDQYKIIRFGLIERTKV